MTLRRSLTTIAPLALFLVIALVLGVGLMRGKPRDLPVDKVRPLPAFALESLHAGQPGLAKEDLAGHVSLINVFASWCASCAVEAPMLEQISRSGAVKLYGVAWLDAPEKSRAWLDRYGDPFERVGMDTTGRLGLDLGVTAAPETFVIDKQGRIRFRQAGVVDEAAWNRVIGPLVAQLDAEPA